MRDEKQPEREIVIKSKAHSWWENFWYHYKWPTIGIAAALIILLVCTLQTCSREKEDVVIVYAGPVYLSSSELSQVSALMDKVVPYDFDENGQAHAAINTYHIYSEEQIKEITAETDESGQKPYVDVSRNSDQYSAYGNYLKTGASSVYLLDPWLYESLRGSDRLRSLQEVFGEMPEGAIDEYGIRLGDTRLYREYGVLQLLPEDTVICLMRPYVIGQSSNEDVYRFETDMFKAIVTYTKDEEA